MGIRAPRRADTIMTASSSHTPVLLERSLAILEPALAVDGAVLVDATLGLGGHAEAALERLEEAGVEHTHMVFNHDDSPSGYARQMHEGVFVRSVYFTDPNGIMLEFAATTRAFGPEDVRHAPASAPASGPSTAQEPA